LELHHEGHGRAGPCLLLVHGLLSSRAPWRPNFLALGQHCRPVVVELLGHGRSPSPAAEEAYRPSSYVARFEVLRRSLGAEQWLVCGQSLGAALTLRYDVAHPERVHAHLMTHSNSAFATPEWPQTVKPSLLVQGVRERRFREHAVWAAANVPRLEVVRVDAGHAVHLEAAAVFDQIERDWLRQTAIL
jgi:pimeloyl-ACP methyl ester carboxylesterase